MKALKFKEVNVTYAKNQPEYNQLPGFKNESERGEFIFCMGLSIKERFILLITGKLWCSLLTFNKPLTPSFFTVKKSDVLTTKK